MDKAFFVGGEAALDCSESYRRAAMSVWLCLGLLVATYVQRRNGLPTFGTRILHVAYARFAEMTGQCTWSNSGLHVLQNGNCRAVDLYMIICGEGKSIPLPSFAQSFASRPETAFRDVVKFARSHHYWVNCKDEYLKELAEDCLGMLGYPKREAVTAR